MRLCVWKRWSWRSIAGTVVCTRRSANRELQRSMASFLCPLQRLGSREVEIMQEKKGPAFAGPSLLVKRLSD
jgi:hypothetical protein